jgi:prepilin-type N-terminal cleavage/methylation domain-containing protein
LDIRLINEYIMKMKKTYSGQNGFSIIELITVIVILGILASVAIPRFSGVKDKARLEADNAAYAEFQSAASLNFARGALGQAGHEPITDADSLKDVLGGLPDGWTASGDTMTSTGNNRQVKIDEQEETGESPAKLVKQGTGW